MRLTIEHHTHYQYSEQVARSTQYLRLTPRPSVRQHIVRWDLDMPEAAAQTTDAFGNILHVLTLDKPHDEIRIRAHGVVEINPDQPVAAGNGLSPLVYQRFTRFTRPDQALLDFATGFERPRSSDDLAALSAAIIERIPYTAGETDATSTAAQAFTGGKGVCQDHTHVLLSVCRQLGLPARYVSGYLYTEDSSHVASHAWAEVWMNDHWYTVDVTNQSLKPDQHLRLAVGMDYLDACPVRGVRYGGGPEQLHTFALVERVETGEQ
ncbi:MAG: transglutaminase family protein [Alcanivoracaceae bacterium]|jgi:transglutaminase-like putative cysteine protease|nr:transglutaminase family protein [Alcanivoracaceae bacterium]